MSFSFFFFLIKEATQLPANILRGKKNETCNILFQRKNKNMESSWYPHPYLHLASVLIQFTSFIVTSFIIYQTINIILAGKGRTRWIDIPYTGWITKLSFPLPTIVRHNISEIKISKKSCGGEDVEDERKRWKASRCSSVNSTKKRRRKRRRAGEGEEISRAKVFNKGGAAHSNVEKKRWLQLFKEVYNHAKFPSPFAIVR